MDYKEKYEQGLECIQEILYGAGDSIKTAVLRKRLQPFFPELKEKESKDERIRKEIIDFLGLPHPQFVGKRDHEKWIAWLEKQSEKKGYTFKSIPRLLDMIVPSEKAKFYCQKLIDTLTKEGYDTDAKIVSNSLKQMNGEEVAIATMDEDEKQGENKPTDKVEPKFKPGDWIIFNGLILHIDEVVNGYYRTTSIGDGIHNSYDWDIDNAARLWTIQEAKDGDVVVRDKIPNYPSPFIAIFRMRSVDTFSSHCFVGFNGNFYKGEVGHSLENLRPATKEQRELLFQKMEEAGCKWDSVYKKIDNIITQTRYVAAPLSKPEMV